MDGKPHGITTADNKVFDLLGKVKRDFDEELSTVLRCERCAGLERGSRQKDRQPVQGCVMGRSVSENGVSHYL